MLLALPAYSRSVAALVLLALAACGDDGAVVDGGRSDGGRSDGGSIRDGGRPTDAPGTDGGPTPDGGMIEEDAGPGMDGGAVDAGPAPDGGPVGSCEDLSDTALRDIVYGVTPRVPPGYFFEPDETMAYPVWVDPCSPDLATTRSRATTLYGAAALTGTERATEQYFEVDALVGGFTVHYRNTSCDYWNGSVFGGAPHDTPDRIPLFASYTWWTEYYNLGGSAIPTGVLASGGPPFTFDLCHVQTVYGDFGLCDEITLYERRFTIARDGTTTIAPDAMIRTVMGTCH